MQRKNPKNLKTKREKKRYILFRIDCEKALDAKEVSSAINEKMVSLFDRTSVAKINPKLIEWNTGMASGILKCERSSKEKALLALHQIREISGRPVSLKIISVSGTIKALKRRIGKKEQAHKKIVQKY